MRMRNELHARFCERPCQPGVRRTDRWLTPFALALSGWVALSWKFRRVRRYVVYDRRIGAGGGECSPTPSSSNNVKMVTVKKSGSRRECLEMHVLLLSGGF